MRELILTLSVLVAARAAFGQVARLTPEVVRETLSRAEKARANAVWLFFFSPDKADMTKFTEIAWSLDQWARGSWGISNRVMQSIR